MGNGRGLRGGRGGDEKRGARVRRRGTGRGSRPGAGVVEGDPRPRCRAGGGRPRLAILAAEFLAGINRTYGLSEQTDLLYDHPD
ncbi:hypothetical protein ABT031_41095, partial [Streptomyces sp. NPDC096934]